MARNFTIYNYVYFRSIFHNANINSQILTSSMTWHDNVENSIAFYSYVVVTSCKTCTYIHSTSNDIHKDGGRAMAKTG